MPALQPDNFISDSVLNKTVVYGVEVAHVLPLELPMSHFLSGELPYPTPSFFSQLLDSDVTLASAILNYLYFYQEKNKYLPVSVSFFVRRPAFRDPSAERRPFVDYKLMLRHTAALYHDSSYCCITISYHVVHDCNSLSLAEKIASSRWITRSRLYQELKEADFCFVNPEQLQALRKLGAEFRATTNIASHAQLGSCCQGSSEYLTNALFIGSVVRRSLLTSYCPASSSSSTTTCQQIEDSEIRLDPFVEKGETVLVPTLCRRTFTTTEYSNPSASFSPFYNTFARMARVGRPSGKLTPLLQRKRKDSKRTVARDLLEATKRRRRVITWHEEEVHRVM